MARHRHPWPLMVTLCIGMVALSGCQVAVAGSGSFAAPASGTAPTTEPTDEPADDASEPTEEPEHPDLRGEASCQIDSPRPEHNGIGSINSVNLRGNGTTLTVTFELTTPPPPGEYEELGIAILGPNSALQDLNLGAVFPGDGDNSLYKIDIASGDILNSGTAPTVSGNTVTLELPAEWFDLVGAEWRWYGYNVRDDSEEDCPPEDSDHLDLAFPE